jgi:hypothetical protein
MNLPLVLPGLIIVKNGRIKNKKGPEIFHKVLPKMIISIIDKSVFLPQLFKLPRKGLGLL